MNYFSKVHLSHLYQKLWTWAEFLTRAIPIISNLFELLFDRYIPKILNITKSVDVVLIRHNDNYTGSSSFSTKDESRFSSSINDEPGESLVDTYTIYFKDFIIIFFFFFFFFLFGRKGEFQHSTTCRNTLIFLSSFNFLFFLTFIFIFNFKCTFYLHVLLLFFFYNKINKIMEVNFLIYLKKKKKKKKNCWKVDVI